MHTPCYSVPPNNVRALLLFSFHPAELLNRGTVTRSPHVEGYQHCHHNKVPHRKPVRQLDRKKTVPPRKVRFQEVKEVVTIAYEVWLSKLRVGLTAWAGGPIWFRQIILEETNR